jgi:hypothetical protein
MSEETTKTTSLDDPKSLRTQAREWVVERIAWVVVAGVLIVGLLGFLGPGPLGKRTSVSADGRLSVQFYSVERTKHRRNCGSDFDWRSQRTRWSD